MPNMAEKMEAYEVAERVMSGFSLLGSFIILSTFICWAEFRKPINRLIFYATFGNVAANIATLISTSALRRIHPDAPTALCQFQGVLIQWFLMADSLWTFCMASNVWLTFFRSYNARQLRSLEKYYLLFCYGVPFVPAFVYLMVDTLGHRGIYGDAMIWCWVSRKWDWMRIAFFYAPVWLVLTATSTIYIITGHNIFRQRNALRSFARNPPSEVEVITNPFTADNSTNIEKVTKIEVVTEKIQLDHIGASPESANESRSSFSSTRNLSTEAHTQNSNNATSSRFPRPHWPYPTKVTADTHHQNMSRTVAISGGNNSDIEVEALPYIAPAAPHVAQIRRRDAARDANRAAWGYAKVAFLMFVALFIVWVPSTVNRVYSLLHPDNPLFGLNLAAAVVLPTQGFWNAMVYMVTSRNQVRMAVKSIAASCRKFKFFGTKSRLSQPKKRPSHPDLASRVHLRKDSVRTLTSPDELGLGPDICMSDIDMAKHPTALRVASDERLGRGGSGATSTTSLSDHRN